MEKRRGARTLGSYNIGPQMVLIIAHKKNALKATKMEWWINAPSQTVGL